LYLEVDALKLMSMLQNIEKQILQSLKVL